MLLRAFVALSSVFILCVPAVAQTSQKSNFSADCLRANAGQIQYMVPFEEAGIVGAFYRDIPDNFLQDMEAVTYYVGDRPYTEKFYDFSDDRLFASGIEVSLKRYIQLPAYRSDRAEITVSKVSPPRSSSSFEVRDYENRTQLADQHPLLGKIRRKEREQFLLTLGFTEGEVLDSMAEKLHVDHQELLLLFAHYGEPVAHFSMDQFHIDSFGVPNTYLQLRFDFDQANLSKLDAEEYAEIDTAFCRILAQLEADIGLERAASGSYRLYRDLAATNLPIRAFYQANPLLFSLGQVVVLGALGGLCAALFLGRCKVNKSYRSKYFSRTEL